MTGSAQTMARLPVCRSSLKTSTFGGRREPLRTTPPAREAGSLRPGQRMESDPTAVAGSAGFARSSTNYYRSSGGSTRSGRMRRSSTPPRAWPSSGCLMRRWVSRTTLGHGRARSAAKVAGLSRSSVRKCAEFRVLVARAPPPVRTRARGHPADTHSRRACAGQ